MKHFRFGFMALALFASQATSSCAQQLETPDESTVVADAVLLDGGVDGWSPFEANPEDARVICTKPAVIVNYVNIGAMQDIERVLNNVNGVDQSYAKKHEASTVAIRFKAKQDVITSGYKTGTEFPSNGGVDGVTHCTGTLIDANRVLTAGHCFGEMRYPAGVAPSTLDGEALTAQQMALINNVVFNYQNDSTGAKREEYVFPITALTEHVNGWALDAEDAVYALGPDKLDYAILTIGPDKNEKMPADYNIAPANIENSEIANNDVIAIIQHPNGFPKKIHAGTVAKAEETRIYYINVDSLGGSSGSAVRNLAGEVIAVHVGSNSARCSQRGEFIHGNMAVPVLALAKESEIVKSILSAE